MSQPSQAVRGNSKVAQIYFLSVRDGVKKFTYYTRTALNYYQILMYVYIGFLYIMYINQC